MKQSTQSESEEPEAASANETGIRRRSSGLDLDLDWTKERRRISLRANGGTAITLCVALLAITMIAARHFGLFP